MSFRLWNIPIRWRILFLTYTIPSIDYDTLKTHFQSHEGLEFEQQYHSLITQKIIWYDGQYCCDCQNEPFLHVLSYLYTSPEPITKDGIRSNVKHRNLNQILTTLIYAGIIFEYRAELNRKNFIVPIAFKEKVIDQINKMIQTKLEQSDKLSDKSHLIMIQQERSILAYGNTSNVRFMGLKPNELKLIVNLYSDIKGKKIRTIGKPIDIITERIFNGNQKIASETVLSLIDKGIIQCSYKEYYFINNTLFGDIEPLFQHNQKYIVKNE